MWILGAYIINDLFQTIQERHHSKVEAAIVQKSTKMEVTGTIQLIGSLVRRGRPFNARERSHGNQPIPIGKDQRRSGPKYTSLPFESEVKLSCYGIEQQQCLSPCSIDFRPFNLLGSADRTTQWVAELTGTPGTLPNRKPLMVPKTPSCPIQNASLYTLVRSSLSNVAESAAYAARSDANCAACSADLSRCALCSRQNLTACQTSYV